MGEDDSERRVFADLDEYITHVGGVKPIKKILIANSGNSAVKAIRSMRHWSYEKFHRRDELKFVVMATLDDVEANAEFISEADFYVEVPSGPNNLNYANVHTIIRIAVDEGCEGIWPGWGHASENYKLPKRLEHMDEGPIWIGPNSSSMLALGDKIASTIIAQSVGVNCVPWSGSHVILQESDLKNLTKDHIKQACVTSPAEAKNHAIRIGFPVMFKASEGGGGKGIRMVYNSEECDEKYLQVINEVRGSPVFVMKLVSHCRHLEVQVVADNYGNVRSVGSRDCSIQRRCQKIIEEGPIVAADYKVVHEMERAAERICVAVGYNNIGTCEFLYDPKSNEIYFLEVNARLQVEHVVTECVNDLNLPAAQLQIAMGVKLESIPDISRYLDYEDSEYNNSEYEYNNLCLRKRKHVIGARITSEHAEKDYRPTTGAVHELSFRCSMYVWGYFSIGPIAKIHPFADSQFGHIFATGYSREEARANLVVALGGLTVRGEIRTNVEALIRVLEHEDFITNKTHTTWLVNDAFEKEPTQNFKEEAITSGVVTAALMGAIYSANRHFLKSEETFQEMIHQGQLPTKLDVTYSTELVYNHTKFTMNCLYAGPHTILVEMNGCYAKAKIRHISADSTGTPSASVEGAFLISNRGIDGRSRRVYYKGDPAGLRVTCDGVTYTFSADHDPTQITAPMSGKLVKWLIPNFSSCNKGEPFVEIEVMKMYMQLPLHESGEITHVLSEGAVFKPGDLIGSLKLNEGITPQITTHYDKPFNDIHSFVNKSLSQNNPLAIYRHAAEAVKNAFDGFLSKPGEVDTQLARLLQAILHPSLPFYELEECLASIETSLPEDLCESIHLVLARDKANVAVNELLELIEARYEEEIKVNVAGAYMLKTQCEVFVDILRRYSRGRVLAAGEGITELLRYYLGTEEVFHSAVESPAKVMLQLRSDISSESLTRLYRSHQALKEKNKLVVGILHGVATSTAWQSSQFVATYLRSFADFQGHLPDLAECFQRLSCLSKPEYSDVATRGRQLILTKRHKPLHERQTHICNKLYEFMKFKPTVNKVISNSPCYSAHGYALVGTIGCFANDLYPYYDDVIVSLFSHEDAKIRKLAMEIFIHRHYDSHGVHDISIYSQGDIWQFQNTRSTKQNELNFSEFTDNTSYQDLLGGVGTPNNSTNTTSYIVSVSSNINNNNFNSYNECKQVSVGLIAIWTCRAVLTEQFLIKCCMSLKSDDPHPIFEEVNNDFDDPSTNYGGSSPYNTSSLIANNKLVHIISAFGESGDNDFNSILSKTQQTICFCFTNMQKFLELFEHTLVEYHTKLNNYVTTPPPSSDARILLLFLGTEIFGHQPPSHIIASELNRLSNILFQCQFYIVSLCYVCHTHQDIEQKYTKNTNHINSEDTEDETQTVPGSEMLSSHSCRYIHFHSLASYKNNNFNKINQKLEVLDTKLSSDSNDTTSPNIIDESRPDEYNNDNNNNNTTSSKFKEEKLIRDVDITLLDLLELRRLKYFIVKYLPLRLPHVHLYAATPRHSTNDNKKLPRFFVRVILRQSKLSFSDNDFLDQERYFVAGLNAFEVATKIKYDRMAGNHMLMTIESRENTDFRTVAITAEKTVRTLGHRYQSRLQKCRVNVIEFRYVQKPNPGNEYCIPVRLVLDNPTGQSQRIRKLVEVVHPPTGEKIFNLIESEASHPLNLSLPSTDDLGRTKLLHSNSTSNAHGYKSDETRICHTPACQYDNQPITVPHPLAGPLDQKRATASNLSTVFIYDFLDLFADAIKKQWRSCPKYFSPRIQEDLREDSTPQGESHHPHVAAFLPDRVFESIELRLTSKGQLEEVHREPGLNECGMVAWRVTMRTPEFPKGRRLIFIGNDITFQMGTFGVQEDLLFQRASELARKEGIPRIYIAVNSGARLGLAQDILKTFKIEWADSENPARGFKYIYLTEKDYLRAKATDSVVAEPIDHPTEGKVYRITTIVGSEIGLGVENLCGSGAIAGETSKAYNSVMTITFVTGRTVGIGAYLARLGHRVIQKCVGAPILLTGYQALNRLIGRDVYTSNEEIGGIDIMHRNGVSHLTVQNDFEGCTAILEWLAFIPEHHDGPLPIMVDPTDPITRTIAYRPGSPSDDPRLMLTGSVDSKGNWQGGLLDRGSFRETLGEWAKSVICGRGRLGGIPLGVILVETRVTETRLPADPAMPHSSEVTLTRAGQVWFPDSAYKTAQAIQDFNAEELPLLVLANWRGFSGGQRDMFNEVLKFGAYIVDALVKYRHPCFIYIPPKAELRGGAWVVVDPRINAEHMEMYADVDCRGSVLEPSGTVEIKLRDSSLIEMASRLDKALIQLDIDDREAAKKGLPMDSPYRQELKERRDARISELLPVYKQCAVHFADLHDTSARMKIRNAVHDVITWEKSRQYFYWRLRRQLILFNLRSEICRLSPLKTLAQAEKMVYKWAAETGHAIETSYEFVQWACHSVQEIHRKMLSVRAEFIGSQTQAFCKEAPAAVLHSIRSLETPLLASDGGLPIVGSKRSQAALSAITQPELE